MPLCSIIIVDSEKMVIKSKPILPFLLTSTLLILFGWQFFTMAAKNTLIFERLVCQPNPENNIFSYFKCEIKHVSRRHLRIHIDGNLTRPLRGAHFHGIAYYKYNTYQMYAVDRWEDDCGWLNGTSQSYLLDWTVKKVLNYSNLNHPCPYEGNIFIKINNISMDRFPLEQLVPSGRYRLDINMTEQNKKNVIVMAKLYIAVSDHRIEQY